MHCLFIIFEKNYFHVYIYYKYLLKYFCMLEMVRLFSYMLLRAEESLFLPPLIPAKFHIFWAVGLWEGQRSVCKRKDV